jgi:putative DNA primase/helicase
MARGRWRSILCSLGVDPALLDSKHQACPFCGGKDRYRWTNHDGGGWYYCNQCGRGDGFKLAHQLLGIPYGELFARVGDMVGAGDLPVDKQATAARDEKVVELLRDATQCVKGDPVCSYLEGRGLAQASKVLRYHPKVYDGTTRRTLPTMVAPIHGPQGKLVGVHLTHLRKQAQGPWVKAPIENAKKQRKVEGTISGGAIRLQRPVRGVVGIAEGIETALAVHQLDRVACWSVSSTSGMVSWQVPTDEELTLVMVYADNDLNYAGQRAAYELANRLMVKDKVEARVVVPDIAGGDWLDVLVKEGGR